MGREYVADLELQYVLQYSNVLLEDYGLFVERRFARYAGGNLSSR
jgi:hypothetical protein